MNLLINKVPEMYTVTIIHSHWKSSQKVVGLECAIIKIFVAGASKRDASFFNYLFLTFTSLQ